MNLTRNAAGEKVQQTQWHTPRSMGQDRRDHTQVT
jgi:hypothetical protein